MNTLPQPTEYAPYYAAYIQEPENGGILSELTRQSDAFPEFLMAVPEARHNYRYQPDKWTFKEVIGHIIETERIMAYRALRISRKDGTPLAGFDQNDYVAQADYQSCLMVDLSEEFRSVRKSNLYLFRSFGADALALKGIASGYEVSVKALLYIISGHLRHHKRILEERYL